MKTKWLIVGLGVGLGALALASLAAPSARAADHLDGPAVAEDAATDITDVYTWMQDGKLVLVMNVFPAAGPSAEFSDAALYAFHVTRRESFVTTTSTETTIICKFASNTAVDCWPGDAAAEITSGDPSAVAGLASASGNFKVFAGLREDPFFFNLAGFLRARTTVIGAASGLTFDVAGCPDVDMGTAGIIVDQLQQDATGGAPVDFFAELNVLSIVVELDVSLLNGTGDFLGVWASTNAAP